MAADAVAVGDGGGDEIFSQFNRVRQFMAERERGADRGRIGAARAMRADAFDKRRGQQQFRFAVVKNIHGLRGIFQVPAFQQNRAAEARENFPRRRAHRLDAANFLAGENFRFRQIRRDERGQREQFCAQHFFRRRLQQSRAARRNHHRIYDQF